MNKYEKLMEEIIEILDGTWLSKAELSLLDDRGSIRGSSIPEVEAVEQELGKKLPDAMKAWYFVAGAVPPYLNDHDADYSLRDLRHAQETAVELTQDEDCEWKLDKFIIPYPQKTSSTGKTGPDDVAIVW